MASRAFAPYAIIFAGIVKSSFYLFQNPENIVFFHENVFFAVDFDFGTGPFAEENPVSGFDLQWRAFSRIH